MKDLTPIPVQEPPHSHRLRIGRVSQAGRIYLITIACHQRIPRLAGLREARCFVRAIKKISPSAFTLCFVVMPDHVHWLMKLEERTDLSSVVQKVKSCTAREVRKANASLSRLWQRGFHDRAVRREESLQSIAFYVIDNPRRAGLVDSLKEYSHWDAWWL